MDQTTTAETSSRPEAESASVPPAAPDDAPPVPADTDRVPSDGGRTERTRVETAETVATDADRQFRGLRFALGVVVAIAVTVILTAIDVQSGRILDREGHGWSFRVLFGPGRLGTNLQGWRVVSEPGQLSDPARYAGLLRAFLVVDFVFITVYFFLLRAVITTLARGRWRRLGMGALLGLVVVRRGGEPALLPGSAGSAGPRGDRLHRTQVVVAAADRCLPGAQRGDQPPRSSPTAVCVRGSSGRTRLRCTSGSPSYRCWCCSSCRCPSGAPILEQLPDALRGWISYGTEGARRRCCPCCARWVWARS